jgi:hypothetical protein
METVSANSTSAHPELKNNHHAWDRKVSKPRPKVVKRNKSDPSAYGVNELATNLMVPDKIKAQAPVYPAPIWIELSQLAAVSVEQNGVYEAVITDPDAVFEDGDQIASMVTINAPQINPNNITIPQDTQVSATFSYYDVDYDTTGKKVLDKSALWQAGGPATFDYYTAYNTKSTQCGIDSIIMEIQGWYKPSGGFGSGGGSYIIPTSAIPGGQWSSPGLDSKIIGFLATFSYINSQGKQALFYASTFNVQEFPTSNPRPGESQYYYGMMSGADLSAATGATLADGQVLMFPVSADGLNMINYPTDVTQGTVALVGIQGGWGGAHQSANTPTIFTWPNAPVSETGATVAGTHPEIASTYDVDSKTGKVLEPYKNTQFDIVSVVYNGGVNVRQLDLKTLTTTITAGSMPFGSFVEAFTQQLSNSQGLKAPLAPTLNQLYAPNNPVGTFVNDPLNVDMVFRRVDITQASAGAAIAFDNTNTYVYADPVTNEPAGYFLGAQQFNIQYQNNFTVVAHTPMQETSQPNEQMVAVYQTGSGTALDPYRYFDIKAATGIVFHEVSPLSLWRDQLGLADKMTVPLLTDSNGLAYYERQQFLDKITEGFLGLDGFPIPGTGPGANWRLQAPSLVNNPTYLNVTGAFKPIIGEAVTQDVAGGLYYVELLGITGSDAFVDSSQTRPFMTSVVSTQYVNNDIVTGDVSQSIVYTHRGAPCKVSRVKVKISEGPLKTPVSGLGPQNTVILQIIKNPKNL